MTKRVAMEVTVSWVTEADEATVRRFFDALDAAGFPGPADFVSEAIHVGARPLDRSLVNVDGGDYDVLVTGPGQWGVVSGERRDGDGDD